MVTEWQVIASEEAERAQIMDKRGPQRSPQAVSRARECPPDRTLPAADWRSAGSRGLCFYGKCFSKTSLISRPCLL